MGFYVNPRAVSKEVWLQNNAILSGPCPRWEDRPKGMLPVVLVSNIAFTALGIAYSEAEFKEFTRPDDNRQREVWWAMIVDLIPVTEPHFSTFVERTYKGEF